MRVLITGGAGFIGSHLVDLYLAHGHEITVYDNLSTGTTQNIQHCRKQIKLVDKDIRDQKAINREIKSSDLVLHMAASLGVNNILNSTIESVSTNFTGSEIVIQASLKHNKRLLIASTSEIYGKNPKQPLSENDDRVVGSPQKIRWTYSDAKALEEAIAHSLFVQKNLPVTTVRFFNTVGPRQTGRYGMVVPRFIKNAIQNKTIEVYGSGDQSRVFCHVSDAVSAVQGLMATESSIGEVFNVGGKGEISINNLAATIIQNLNSNSKITHIPYESAYAPGFEDMAKRIPDISKIDNFLNWKPKKSLNEIISDTAEYIRQNDID